MEIVNGYVCKDCSDVSLAKKGVDPASKSRFGQLAAPEEQEGAARLRAPFRPREEAESAGGGPESALYASRVEQPRGVNFPLTEGIRGTRVNLLA